MSEARRPAARTPAHEAFLRFPMEGLRANIARATLCVVRAFSDRDRNGLLVFFVGVILLRVAAAVYFLTRACGRGARSCWQVESQSPVHI